MRLERQKKWRLILCRVLVSHCWEEENAFNYGNMHKILTGLQIIRWMVWMWRVKECWIYLNYSLQRFPFPPGWTMVFKAISNVSSAILQPLWTSADTLNEENTDVLSPGSFPREHYKNRFIQNWQTADPKEVGVIPLELCTHLQC